MDQPSPHIPQAFTLPPPAYLPHCIPPLAQSNNRSVSDVLWAGWYRPVVGSAGEEQWAARGCVQGPHPYHP